MEEKRAKAKLEKERREAAKRKKAEEAKSTNIVIGLEASSLHPGTWQPDDNDNNDIVDQLVSEIKAGASGRGLRKRQRSIRRGSVVPGLQLSKLQEIAKQAAIESSKADEDGETLKVPNGNHSDHQGVPEETPSGASVENKDTLGRPIPKEAWSSEPVSQLDID